MSEQPVIEMAEGSRWRHQAVACNGKVLPVWGTSAENLKLQPLPSAKEQYSDDEFQRQQFKFEALLASGACSDPLQAWNDYAKLMIEHKPKECASVLARACKALTEETRWQNDIRLLRLWIRLAMHQNRDTIHKFLGSLEEAWAGHALLYETWAASLEKQRLYVQAEAVYQRGLNQCAQPLERLQNRYAEFQRVVARRKERAARARPTRAERVQGQDARGQKRRAPSPARENGLSPSAQRQPVTTRGRGNQIVDNLAKEPSVETHALPLVEEQRWASRKVPAGRGDVCDDKTISEDSGQYLVKRRRLASPIAHAVHGALRRRSLWPQVRHTVDEAAAEPEATQFPALTTTEEPRGVACASPCWTDGLAAIGEQLLGEREGLNSERDDSKGLVTPANHPSAPTEEEGAKGGVPSRLTSWLTFGRRAR